MRIAACTVVAVLAFSADALAQPPVHANGKAHAFGHSRHVDFAANDFKVGLTPGIHAGKELPSASRGRHETPVVHIDLPSQPQARKSSTQAPDCVRR